MRTHYLIMNNYPQEMYSEVLEFDAVYENRAAYNDRKYKKNARRAQRKAKQAQRNRYWDTF